MPGRDEAEFSSDGQFAAVQRGRRYEPGRFDHKFALRQKLDPNYARLWIEYGYGGLLGRDQLDAPTRLLVLIGQFAMARNQTALHTYLEAAFRWPLPAIQVLEVLIQTQLHGGTNLTDDALEELSRVAERFDAFPAIQDSQLPTEGHLDTRDLAVEQRAWSADDKADPRLAPLLERYGWHGFSVGLRPRPRHHLDIVQYFDALDPGLTDLWLRTVYAGYYDQRILDDRTRLLCHVGNCIVLGEQVQGCAHMAGALRAGTQPEELLEAIVQSSFFFGQVCKVNFLGVLVELLDDLGRLDEIGNPPAAVH